MGVFHKGMSTVDASQLKHIFRTIIQLIQGNARVNSNAKHDVIALSSMLSHLVVDPLLQKSSSQHSIVVPSGVVFDGVVPEHSLTEHPKVMDIAALTLSSRLSQEVEH